MTWPNSAPSVPPASPASPASPAPPASPASPAPPAFPAADPAADPVDGPAAGPAAGPVDGTVAGRSRSRSSAVAPPPRVSWYQNAHFVPVRPGFTVGAPLTTWSLMPSFGYGVTGCAPNSRRRLVSFSQNSCAGSAPSGPGPAVSSSGPRNGWPTATDEASVAAIDGRGAPISQDQVLRNQAVGSTCSVAGSGLALVTEIAISRSSGSAFA